jgi:excisionase family DNA binding protein
MGKKMYYTEAEAAERLGVPAEQLAQFVRDGKLRAFRDGANRMFRADEVDALGAEAAGSSAAGEIELSPADSAAGDVVSLEEAEVGKAADKEDTVITAEGISIFDDEDLEVEAADPLAKTQIAPSLEDQIAMEGVGSGSGLLDLTRESDDTSLGAEVLENIDLDSAEIAEEIGEPSGEVPAPAAPAAPAAPVVVEAPDAFAGLFTGFVVGCALLLLLLSGAAVAAMQEALPGYLESLKSNMAIVLVVCAVVVLIAGAVGYFLGTSVLGPKETTRRLGA